MTSGDDSRVSAGRLDCCDAAHCEGIRAPRYGANLTYPPTTSMATSAGFNLKVEIPDGRVKLRAKYLGIIAAFDFYQRFTGSFMGTWMERRPDGVSLWEQFTLQE